MEPSGAPFRGAARACTGQREPKSMANIKSAKKRVLVAERNRARNKTARTLLRTQVKKFREAVAAGEKSAAAKLLRAAHAVIDRTARKGVIHARTANRYKSRLALANARLHASA